MFSNKPRYYLQILHSLAINTVQNSTTGNFALLKKVTRVKTTAKVYAEIVLEPIFRSSIVD